MGMTIKIDRETGEISEEVSDEEFKEIMRAWKARRVSDEEFEEIRKVWKTTTVRCEDCFFNPRAAVGSGSFPTAQSFNHP